jgi:hypothetical protein
LTVASREQDVAVPGAIGEGLRDRAARASRGKVMQRLAQDVDEIVRRYQSFDRSWKPKPDTGRPAIWPITRTGPFQYSIGIQWAGARTMGSAVTARPQSRTVKWNRSVSQAGPRASGFSRQDLTRIAHEGQALDVEVGGRTHLAVRALRRDAAERHQAIAALGVELLPDAQVPAVVEVEHAPLVAMAGVLAIGVRAEVLARVLAVDPADVADDLLLEVAPYDLPDGGEPGLEVGERAELRAAGLDAVRVVTADRRRRLPELGIERHRHGETAVIATHADRASS